MKKTSLAEDQERMGLFQNQLKQMNEDYEFMKRNKEEAKKQLDARFQDIDRKIQGSRDFIAAESKRIMDTLVAFQHKFQHQLQTTKDDFDSKIASGKQETDSRLKGLDERLDSTQSALEEEKAERIKQSEENSKDIKEKLEKLTQLVESEKSSRMQKETFLLNKLNEEVFKMSQAMKAQKDDRNLKVKEVREYAVHQIESQTKYNEEFHKKNFQEFSSSLAALENEMNVRFSNKDEIINSLSKVVKTLQSSFRQPN